MFLKLFLLVAFIIVIVSSLEEEKAALNDLEKSNPIMFEEEASLNELEKSIKPIGFEEEAKQLNEVETSKQRNLEEEASVNYLEKSKLTSFEEEENLNDLDNFQQISFEDKANFNDLDKSEPTSFKDEGINLNEVEKLKPTSFDEEENINNLGNPKPRGFEDEKIINYLEKSKPKSLEEEGNVNEPKWQRVFEEEDAINVNEVQKSKPISFEALFEASGRSRNSNKRSQNRHQGLDFSNVNCKGDIDYPSNRPSSPVISIFKDLKTYHECWRLCVACRMRVQHFKHDQWKFYYENVYYKKFGRSKWWTSDTLMTNLTYGQMVDSTGDDIYAYSDEVTGKNMFKEDGSLVRSVRTLNKAGVGRMTERDEKYPGCITIEMLKHGFVRFDQVECTTNKAYCACKGEKNYGYVDKCIKY